MKKTFIQKLVCFLLAVTAAGVSAACEKTPVGEKPSYTVSYIANENGKISGNGSQTVAQGAASQSVSAYPNLGYVFDGWSDGVTDSTRRETDVRSNLTLYAEFSKAKLTVRYIAESGGRIEGTATQSLSYGDTAEQVTAIPDAGHNFAYWSDGSQAAARQDTNIRANLTIRAVFSKKGVNARYTAAKGGRIEGEAEQYLWYGDRAAAVTAVPDPGYIFIGWSDGVQSATRRDTLAAEAHIDVTASFKRVRQTFTYAYNEATGGDAAENITVSCENWHTVTLALPQRAGYTFGGWYLEWYLSTPVTDASGSLVIDADTLFGNDADRLYAKWTAAEQVTYKILMVFVTEIHAALVTNKGVEVRVDYVMSEIERQMFELIPPMMQNYLNAMLNGLVTFEVDAFFTTDIISSESFFYGIDRNGFWNYGIMGYGVHEINDILGDYRSVVTTFCMNDYNELLKKNNVAGGGMRKYAYVHAETLFSRFILNGAPLENLLDELQLNDPKIWDNIIEPYIHEFTHTVQLAMDDAYDYHSALGLYGQQQGITVNELEVTQLYLLNRLYINRYINGEYIGWDYVGIPYDFWVTGIG
jgi:uncharacterized repeat protein (TIGR02543 family)